MGRVAKDIIKELFNESLFPQLKNRGFEKNAFSWHRFEEDVIKVVDAQMFRCNPNHASFTLNLGIYHDGFHEFTDSIPFLGVIDEIDCDVRIRVAELLGLEDHWWEVNLNDSNQFVKEDFINTLDKWIYPWIDSKWNLSTMYAYFVSHNLYFHAGAAAYLMHNETMFKIHMKCCLEESKKMRQMGRKRHTEKWLNDHGLSI